MAEVIAPIPLDKPFIAAERAAAKQVFDTTEEPAKERNSAVEQIFALVYGAG